MKALLSRNHKLKYDKNFASSEWCSAIIQKNLQPKLNDSGIFTIPCSFGSLNTNHALCNLETNINLMLLYMMRNLNCGEPKPTLMTLTLADWSTTYLYGVLEDVLVRADDLLFLSNFVILDMSEDSETPLMLGRSFLVTSIACEDFHYNTLLPDSTNN